MLAMPNWWAADKAKQLEPVDDVMKALIAKNGAVSPLIEYLGKVGGHWVAIPATPGSQIKGPCGRIDLFKQHAGLDLTKMYPAGAAPDKALSDAWTWDAFLAATEKCHKAGFPRSASAWARPPTRSTPWARCSARTARSWSTPRATSRSSPTR